MDDRTSFAKLRCEDDLIEEAKIRNGEKIKDKTVSWTDKEVRYPTIALLGFLMPLYQTLGAALIYTLTQLLKVSSELAAGTSNIVIIGVVLFSAYAICGDISDFADGMEFAMRAPIYLVSGIIGLWFFWKIVAKAPNVGSDAIIATITSLILISAGMVFTLYQNRDSIYTYFS